MSCFDDFEITGTFGVPNQILLDTEKKLFKISKTGTNRTPTITWYHSLASNAVTSSYSGTLYLVSAQRSDCYQHLWAERFEDWRGDTNVPPASFPWLHYSPHDNSEVNLAG